MSNSSRKKTRTSAGEAMKLIAKPEPALTYAARDSFAFSEGPREPAPEPPTQPKSESAPAPAPASQAAPVQGPAAPAPAPASQAAPVQGPAAPAPAPASQAAPAPASASQAAPAPASAPASQAAPAPSFAKPPFAAPAALFGKGLGELGRGNVEAAAQAGAILAKGLEEMSQSVVALGQRNLESSLNLAKAAIGTTTLRQLVDLQTGYARDSFDRLVAEGQKLQEMSLKTANAAMQPLKARVAETIGTLTSKAA
jgi:phasin family protein